MKKILAIIFLSLVLTVFPSKGTYTNAEEKFKNVPAVGDPAVISGTITESLNVNPDNAAPKSFVANLPITCTEYGNCTICDVMKLLATIMQWLLSTIAAMALFFLIYGGFDLLTSGGNPEKIDGGKKKILGSIIGLVIVLAAYGLIGAILVIFTEDIKGTNNGFNPKTWSTFQCKK